MTGFFRFNPVEKLVENVDNPVYVNSYPPLPGEFM